MLWRNWNSERWYDITQSITSQWHTQGFCLPGIGFYSYIAHFPWKQDMRLTGRVFFLINHIPSCDIFPSNCSQSFKSKFTNLRFPKYIFILPPNSQTTCVPFLVSYHLSSSLWVLRDYQWVCNYTCREHLAPGRYVYIWRPKFT